MWSRIYPAVYKFPIGEKERFYGLGMQLLSFLQNGKRKKLNTNADAVSDTGESHGPVPFYLSSDGYGVLIDSAATVEIDFGGVKRLPKREMGCNSAAAPEDQRPKGEEALAGTVRYRIAKQIVIK